MLKHLVSKAETIIEKTIVRKTQDGNDSLGRSESFTANNVATQTKIYEEHEDSSL